MSVTRQVVHELRAVRRWGRKASAFTNGQLVKGKGLRISRYLGSTLVEKVRFCSTRCTSLKHSLSLSSYDTKEWTFARRHFRANVSATKIVRFIVSNVFITRLTTKGKLIQSARVNHAAYEISVLLPASKIRMNYHLGSGTCYRKPLIRCGRTTRNWKKK